MRSVPTSTDNYSKSYAGAEAEYEGVQGRRWGNNLEHIRTLGWLEKSNDIF